MPGCQPHPRSKTQPGKTDSRRGAHSLTRRGRPPGAQGNTPFSTRIAGFAKRRKAPSAEETGTAQGGADTQKTRPGSWGEHSLSQPQSPARMSTERTETAYRCNLNDGTPLLVVYGEEREFVLTEGSKSRPKRRLNLIWPELAKVKSDSAGAQDGSPRPETKKINPRRGLSGAKRTDVICSPGRRRRAGEQITGARKEKRN